MDQIKLEYAQRLALYPHYASENDTALLAIYLCNEIETTNVLERTLLQIRDVLGGRSHVRDIQNIINERLHWLEIIRKTEKPTCENLNRP